MNKVFSFVKYARFVSLALAITCIVLHCYGDNPDNRDAAIGIYILCSMGIIAFLLCMLLICSAKKSPLKIPAILEILSYIAFFAGVLWEIDSCSYAWLVLHICAFLYLAKYFLKGSLTKTMCYCLAFNSMFIHYQGDVLSNIIPAIGYTFSTIFLFAFYKQIQD